MRACDVDDRCDEGASRPCCCSSHTVMESVAPLPLTLHVLVSPPMLISILRCSLQLRWPGARRSTARLTLGDS